MSSQKKRAREIARRREEKWQERRAKKEVRRRRRWSIAAAITAVALVAVIVVAVVAQPDAPTDADTPAPTDSAAGTTSSPPSADLAEGRTWTSVIQTDNGPIELSLDGAAAPQAVASFISLANSGFFDGTSCHRLTASPTLSVLQCGDPSGNGSGGPDYRFGPVENAPADGVYPAGTVAMARVSNDPNSMGSQFFLVYEDSTIPDDTAGGYTIFGTITSGLDTLQAIADAGIVGGSSDGQPATPVTIEGVETQ